MKRVDALQNSNLNEQWKESLEYQKQYFYSSIRWSKFNFGHTVEIYTSRAN